MINKNSAINIITEEDLSKPVTAEKKENDLPPKE